MSAVIVGDVFGDLEVLSVFSGERPSGLKSYKAKCKCSCGNISDYERGNLTSGNSKNCTDCRRLKAGLHKITHGHSYSRSENGSKESKCYYTWQAMKRRCLNETDSRWADYGGRGISVCAEWIASYEEFLADMGLPPTMAHQIDRSNNDGNYCKENCLWVTATENGRNKRNNNMITAFGKTQPMSSWAAELGIKRETIAMRMKRGYSAEMALQTGNDRIRSKTYITPNGSFASLRAAAESHSMSISGASGRFDRESCPDWIVI